MWDLPGPGLEPVSPALAGGFLTTAPSGKPGGDTLKAGSGFSGENGSVDARLEAKLPWRERVFSHEHSG